MQHGIVQSLNTLVQHQCLTKKTMATIRKRIHGKESKAAKEILQERYDCAEHLGTYGPSIGVQCDDVRSNQPNNNSSNAKASNNKGANKTTVKCALCAQEGHKARRSASCKQHEQ